MNYDILCEMDIGELMNSLKGQVEALDLDKEEASCTVQKPVQPTDDIGTFGNESDIHIKVTPEGGIEVDSKEMAFKLSSDVFDAIKSFLAKGE